MLFPWQTGRTMKLFKKYVFLILEVLEYGISIVQGILSFLNSFHFESAKKAKIS